jgi:uncharacterized membrane protein
MTLAPLLSASPAIKPHAFTAMAAFALDVVQLSGPKGAVAHRNFGWAWVVLMLVIYISAFWLRLRGSWSPFQLLAIFTLIMLPIGVLHARRHRVVHHRYFMMSIFRDALLIAGLFTFFPGRMMRAVTVGH